MLYFIVLLIMLNCVRDAESLNNGVYHDKSKLLNY